MLLLLLLQLAKGVWGLLKAKCTLTVQRDEMNPKNHYRPGDISIGGVISATQAFFGRLSFKRNPSTPVLE